MSMEAARRRKMIAPHRKMVAKLLDRSSRNVKVNMDEVYLSIYNEIGRNMCREIVALDNFNHTGFERWLRYGDKR